MLTLMMATIGTEADFGLGLSFGLVVAVGIAMASLIQP
jgi:hypothetical protein